MNASDRESSDELALADLAATKHLENVFQLMNFSKNRAITDVMEYADRLSPPERKLIMQQLNTMRNPDDITIRIARKILILLFTKITPRSFVPEIASDNSQRVTRWEEPDMSEPLPFKLSA